MIFDKYTNNGPRKVNEDALFISKKDEKCYACIADGVGGIKHGDFASQFVVNKYANYSLNNENSTLQQFITKTNDELILEASEQLNVDRVGTTFTAAIISKNFIEGIHVGDSRLCVLRRNGIKQLTDEHNEAGRLVREGKLKPKDKNNYPRRNIIEHIMGDKKRFKYQSFSFELQPKDRILLSTDGFHDSLPKMEIRDISVKYKSFHEFHRHLIIEIQNRILHDNTTFISIEI